MKNKTLFWLVGDKSGDLHTSKVMECLNANHKINHTGIGGTLMQNQGLIPLFPFEKFLIMGFAEVIKHIPFIIKVEKTIKKYLMENKPDLVILVDYPGLNLRIAKLAHKIGIKVFYYICPQFWAWKKYRILSLKKYCHQVACILPFEKEMLDEYDIKSEYVGHPVVEEICISLDKESFAEKYKLDINKKWIGFFPGSRNSEIKKLLPIFQDTIKILKKKKTDYEFLISNVTINGNNYETMKYCDFLIVKSGTSTIETAITGTPFAIVYKVNYLSYKLAKIFIKIKNIGLPNIIINKSIVPEIIQNDVNPDTLMNTILFYMENKDEYDKMANNFKDLHDILGKESASKNTALLIANIP